MNRASPPIVFFGSSGYAAALRDVMRRSDTLVPLFDVVAYIDDYRGDRGETLEGSPIISFARWQAEFHDVPCFVTVGDTAARRTIAERLRAAGATFPPIYDRTQIDVPVGEGTYVSAGLRLGAGSSVGSFGHVLPFAIVDAGVRIGDFVTICPRVAITGSVVVEDGAFLGAGSRIEGGDAEPLRIGRGVRVAAGAVVTESVGDGMRAYGDPARVIDKMHVIR